MKKMICILLAISLVLVLCACGGNADMKETRPQETTGKQTQPTQNDTVNEVPEVVQNTMDLDIRYTDKMCKVPENYGTITDGYATVVGKDAPYVTVICCDGKNDTVSKLEEVLDHYAMLAVDQTGSYLAGSIDYQNLKANSYETVNVSGFDALRFSERIPNKKDVETQVYGYSMVIDGAAVLIMGICTEEKLSAEMVQEMETLVDQMVNSIH